MPNLVGRRADLLLRVGAAAAAIAVATTVATLTVYGSPRWSLAQHRAEPQPVMFSHEHHVGALGLDCRYCHQHAAESDFAGMPAAATCMHCHAQLYTTAPMLEPVRQAWRTGQPVHWTRVYQAPDFVLFSHKVHIHAGVACVSCHGRMDEQPLTVQASPMTMGWCIDCHRAPEGRLVRVDEVYDPAARPGSAPAATVDRKDLLTNCSACHY